MNLSRRLIASLLFAVSVLFLVACNASTPAPQVVTATPPPATKTAVPTATTEPTATTVPTTTPEPTATEEPTVTPTPEPTSLGTLATGETETGSIEEPGDEAMWTVEGEDGVTIFAQVETVSDDIRPVLTLLDPDGFEVATSAASDDEEEASLIYTYEDDGDYSLVVSFLGRETGAYELTAYNVESGGGEMELGMTVNSIIVGGVTEDLWTFTADAGTFVNISVEADDEDDFDTVIELLNEDGDQIARDDDSGEGYNPQLTGIPLLESGDYTIRVYALSSNEAGAYELTLSVGESAGGGTIAFDQPVQGELTSAPQLWTFEGQAGERVEISLSAMTDTFGLDPRLTLLDPAGSELASDDDGGEGLNSLLTNITLPVSGTYTIQISAYSGEGEFELILRRPVIETAGTLTIGQTMTGTLATSSPQVWTFEGQEGITVTIEVNAGEGTTLDPMVSLVDPNNQEIALDDDSGDSLNSLISDFVLPATGTYSVYVSAVSGEGEYTVTVRAAGQ